MSSTADGQVNVELRLMMDKFRKDMSRVASEIKKSLGDAFNVDKGNSSKQATDQLDKETSKVRTLTSEIRKLKAAKLEAWRQTVPAPVVTDTSSESSARRLQLEELRRHRAMGLRGYNAQQFYQQLAQSNQNPTGSATGGNAGLATTPSLGGAGSGGGAPPSSSAAASSSGGSGYNGPAPPVIRQQTSMWSNLTRTVAWAAGGLAAFRVAVGLVKYAFEAMIAPLRMVVNFMRQQAESARRLYSSALSSGGMSLGFTSRRNNLADLLGVGADDIWQYSKQIDYLNDRIEYASDVLAKTAPELTSLSWEWRAMELQFKALGSMIAQDLVPPMRGLITVMATWAKGVMYLHDIMANSKLIKGAMALASVMNPLTAGPAMAFAGLSGVDKLAGNHAAPDPVSSSKRMQASPWERMGLVIGSGMGERPEKTTAKNTTMMVKSLREISGKLGHWVAPRGPGQMNNNSRVNRP